jgi:hypothetical protein
MASGRVRIDGDRALIDRIDPARLLVAHPLLRS